MILQAGLTTVLAFGPGTLPSVFARPENRLLRPYFREYELSHCTDSTELAHVQMGIRAGVAWKTISMRRKAASAA